ncbi:MAG: hypothetical protein MJ177_04835 [Clostridia bacterium]|nr:hypothetical protein [Clostridia bacterium]
MNFAAIDFEMPNNFSPKICAYGTALIKNGAITETDGSLVNPQTSFENFIIELIGITPAMVAGQPTFPEIWDRLRNTIEKADVIIAHNAVCDLTILSKCLRHYEIEWKDKVKYICTCEMGTACYPELGKYSLKSLCDHLEIPLDNHSADSDSVGCARLLLNYISMGADIEEYIKEFDMVNGAPIKNGVTRKKKTVEQTVRNTLFTMSSKKNKIKAEKRLKDVDRDKVIGTPINTLYMIAKQLRQKNTVFRFLSVLPHEYHEENDLHAIAVSGIHNEKKCRDAVNAFLPYIDNCETCDLLNPSVFRKRRDRLYEALPDYLASDEKFTVRFALNMLTGNLTDDDLYMDFFDDVMNISVKSACTDFKRAEYLLKAFENHPRETLYLLENYRAKKGLIKNLLEAVKKNANTDREHLARLASLSE